MQPGYPRVDAIFSFICSESGIFHDQIQIVVQFLLCRMFCISRARVVFFYPNSSFFLVKNGLLPTFQHGFLKGRSSDTARL
jgi:hypothetical protein